MTWQSKAAEEIEIIAGYFDADISVKERRKALNESGDFFAGGAHWPRKAWAKAQRAHMERHGQPKGYGKRKPVETTGDLL